MAGTPAVLIVTPGGLRQRGGIGRGVSTIVRWWRESGRNPPLRVVDPYGPGILSIAPFYFARALLEILRSARRGRVALLHVQMASWGSVVRKGIIVHLGARLGLPVVLHIRGGDFDAFYRRLPAVGQRLLRCTLERADRVVVLGEHWRRVLVEQIGVTPSRVRVLPNAVAGPQDVPRRDGPDPCRLLFLGRLEPAKGFPELLDALADPRLARLDWSARAAGEGPVRALRRRAAALGLAGRLEISGWVPESEARRLLAESDVLVLPSHFEGLSLAVLEALAFGLAVVSTPVGALGDAVIDGVSGLQVPVGDRRALAVALARLIEDRPLRAALQAGARQRYRQSFDIAQHGRRLERLYREVLQPGARPAWP